MLKVTIKDFALYLEKTYNFDCSGVKATLRITFSTAVFIVSQIFF